ncbi:hypothetical protein A6R68_19103, partial [Neotoma lepida]
MGGTPRWPSELAFCHWLATGRKRKVQDKALWEIGSRGETQCGTPNSESDSLVVCEVDPELKEKLRKFRFRKETDNAAIIMKVDKDRQMVVLEEEFQ